MVRLWGDEVMHEGRRLHEAMSHVYVGRRSLKAAVAISRGLP